MLLRSPAGPPEVIVIIPNKGVFLMFFPHDSLNPKCLKSWLQTIKQCSLCPNDVTWFYKMWCIALGLKTGSDFGHKFFPPFMKCAGGVCMQFSSDGIWRFAVCSHKKRWKEVDFLYLSVISREATAEHLVVALVDLQMHSIEIARIQPLINS